MILGFFEFLECHKTPFEEFRVGLTRELSFNEITSASLIYINKIVIAIIFDLSTFQQVEDIRYHACRHAPALGILYPLKPSRYQKSWSRALNLPIFTKRCWPPVTEPLNSKWSSPVEHAA